VLAEIENLTGELHPLEQATVGLDSLREQVNRYRQAELLTRERRRLETDRLAVMKSIEEWTSQLRGNLAKVAELEKGTTGKTTVTGRLQEAEREREKLVVRYRDLNAEVKVAEEKLAGLEEQKRQIGQLGPEAVCQACLRPFGDELPAIEKHFNEEIDRFRRYLGPLRDELEWVKQEGTAQAGRIDSLKKELERLNRLETEWAAVTAAIAPSEAQLSDGNRRLAEIDKRLAEIGEVAFEAAVLAKDEAALVQMENQKEKYIRLADRFSRRPQVQIELTQAGEALAALQTESAEIAAELARLAFDETAYQEAQADLTRGRDRAATIRLQIERLTGGIKLLESETGNLTRQLEEYERSQAEIGRLRQSLTYLEKLSMLFADFRVFLIGRIRPTLSRQTSQLFHEMTGGRYQEVELDEDYNLCLYDRGERFPAARFSGGEIDLLNLCFRLAISVEMASTAGIEQSFIILDEIFGSQDRQRQQLIVEGLGRLKSRFRQIIIISHIEEVKEMSEHIISVEVDEAGISRAAMSESA
jgi:exonuclease SbcC